jgi:hypothetical protein
MNGALDYYDNNELIWSISGFSIPIKIPNNYNHDVYLSYRASSWGWATWLDRWIKVDWNVCDYKKFRADSQLRKKFNRGGRDLSNMLDMQISKKIDSWAIRWCYSQFKLNTLTVYPITSRIQNIGLDGSGTHGVKTNIYTSNLKDINENCKFENVELNKKILNNFQDHYIKKNRYYINVIKNLIKKIIWKVWI